MSKKYYVVWQGIKPGVYANWSEAKAQIEGQTGAQYMGFTSEEAAARAFAEPYGKALKQRVAAKTGAGETATQKRPDSGAKARGKPSGKTRGKSAVAKPLILADINIYSDGACSPNPGKAGTGIAIYHQDQAKILWYGLYEAKGTNNSAELNGLLKGFQIAEHYLKQQLTVQVLSDSKYSIDCVTKWAKGWKSKGWKRGQGEAIKNLELIQQCYTLYEQIKSQISVTHVKGHAGIEGNELADRMAVLARSKKESDFVRYEGELDIAAILAMTSG